MNLEHHYTNERNYQIVLALLKAHNIRKVIASPGSTNISFVGSVQNDPFFEVYSCIDERSAAYMAVGMAEESGEPVVISCTGATASRNYLSALTEAYYRKLPIVAITSTHEQALLGNLIPQVIDRSISQNDIKVISVHIPTVKDENDEWFCQIEVNRALNALYRNGGGPIHLNVDTANVRQPFSVKSLTNVRVVRRVSIYDEFPQIPIGRIGIFVGAHAYWEEELTIIVDSFCEIYNAVVFCDHTSGYNGKYKVMSALLGAQDKYRAEARNMDLAIHIGQMSGSYESYQVILGAKNVWRVCEDGQICDTFKKMSYIFDMPEKVFFEKYSIGKNKKSCSYYQACINEYKSIIRQIPELPLSNLWVAQNTAPRLPENCQIHFGILNTLRSWNFFEISDTIRAFCNVGGFGIDGCISSLVGASLCNKTKLYFGVFGDLSFFYDINVLGNRHVGNNIRIILINNGKGVEFRNYYHQGAPWGKDADMFIAAGGHNGQQSPCLVRHFVEDLGFEYISVRSKEEYAKYIEHFTSCTNYEKPLFMEIFTKTEDEVNALYEIRNIMTSQKEVIKQAVSNAIKSVAGKDGVETIKKIIKY